MSATWRTLHAAEEDYVRDLATRWQTWSYVAAGAGLVLAIIAASMHGYLVPGFTGLGNNVSYGLAGVIGGGGLLLSAILQIVARRLARDLASARVEAVVAEARAEAHGKYVQVAAAGERFLLARPDWLKTALPLGAAHLTLEVTPVCRVVLTVNGLPVYGPAGAA